jgi:hypothetical protein
VSVAPGGWIARSNRTARCPHGYTNGGAMKVDADSGPSWPMASMVIQKPNETRDIPPGFARTLAHIYEASV